MNCVLFHSLDPPRSQALTTWIAEIYVKSQGRCMNSSSAMYCSRNILSFSRAIFNKTVSWCKPANVQRSITIPLLLIEMNRGARFGIKVCKQSNFLVLILHGDAAKFAFSLLFNSLFRRPSSEIYYAQSNNLDCVINLKRVTVCLL